MNLSITVSNVTIPTVQQKMLVSVTFDEMLTFNTHDSRNKTNIKKRNNVMKSMVGNDWCKQKETLITAKKIYRLITNCAAPIWTP